MEWLANGGDRFESKKVDGIGDAYSSSADSFCCGTPNTKPFSNSRCENGVGKYHHCLCGLTLSRKRSVPFGSSPHFIGLFFWWRDDDPYVQYGRRFILPCWDAVVKEVPFRKVYLDL